MRKIVATALLMLIIVPAAPLRARTQPATADIQLSAVIDPVAQQVLKSTGCRARQS